MELFKFRLLCVLGVFALLSLDSLKAHGACASPVGQAGDIVYNSDFKIFQYCKNTIWKKMNPQPGSGTGPCSLTPSGTLAEGAIIYLPEHRMMAGCAGDTLVSFGNLGSSNGFVQVTTSINPNSGDHSCGIKKDGTLWCWGSNSGGRTGLNTGSGSTNIPTQVSGGGQWKLVRAGHEHSCALKIDNTIWCFGNNGGGRTGLNTGSGSALVPTQISGGGTWKKFDTGMNTCAIKSDDTLWCWGPNSNGQGGDGTTTQQLVATPISGGGTWLDVDVGGYYACAVNTAGVAYCWGGNSYGATGYGSGAGSNLTATMVSGGHTWKEISAGERDTCGIKTDDTAMCWGGGTTTPVAVPGGGTWKNIDVGYGYRCAMNLSNNLYCWGGNSSGQLGDGTYTARTNPTQVLGGGTWLSVGAGWFHTCGVKSNGSLLCWGDNAMGETGLGTWSYDLNPVQVKVGTVWNKVNVGTSYTCGIDANDSLYCWGSNSNGRTGFNTNGDNTSAATVVSGGGQWSLISAGDLHSCGIMKNGTLKCWGNNANGKTGLNTAAGDALVPTTVSGGGTWISVSAGLSHTCGIQTSGDLYCWGVNTNGRTGLNLSAGNTLVPTLVSSGTTWSKVAVGYAHSCAIQSGGAIYCWGLNTNGQIGDGTSGTDRLVPTLISGGFTYNDVDVSMGATSFSCGVTTANVLKCWGSNSSGQTGFNTSAGNSLTAATVSGGGSWMEVSLGSSHACAVKTNGALSCWGNHSNGQTGQLLSSGSIMAPANVSFSASWKKVSTGANHTCGLTAAGAQLCWGANGNYELTSSPASVITRDFTPRSVVCSSPTGKPGDIFYNSTQNILQFCDGSQWMQIGP